MGLRTQTRIKIPKSLLFDQEISKPLIQRPTNIVIVGDKKIRFRLKRMEAMFNIMLIFVNVDKVNEAIGPNTISVIFDEEKLGEDSKSLLKKFIEGNSTLPVFFLSRIKQTTNFYNQLYQLGLQGIINWPSEGLALPNLLIETLRSHPKATGINLGDKKLSKIVKSHLVLLGDFKNIRVVASNGLIFLYGEVLSLWEKQLIELETIKVLGVKKVYTQSVVIETSQSYSNQQVLKKIKSFISLLKNENNKPIDVEVKNFKVRITGSREISHNLLSIEEFAMKQHGVKSVTREFDSTKLNSKNSLKVKLVEKSINAIFPNVSDIKIRLFGKYAEVSGFVKLPVNIGLIGNYIFQMLPVVRVINKLTLKK